jgi:hypothetical protein
MGNLIRGQSYGQIAQKIYLMCCDEFGFDKSLSYKFVYQQPLYAETEINGEIYGVWTFAHSNLNGTVAGSGNWTNIFDGNLLYFMYKPNIDDRFAEKKIVFAKVSGEYVFQGCYKKIKDDKLTRTQTYELYSNNYPD